MKGDFSVLNFDPLENTRGVADPSDGVLRNLGAVLHQQGRLMSDADLTEGQLLGLGWQDQAARDVIGADVCAVPADEPVEIAPGVLRIHADQLYAGRRVLHRGSHVVPGSIANRTIRLELGIQTNVLGVRQTELKSRIDRRWPAYLLSQRVLDLRVSRMMHEMRAIHEADTALATG